MAKSGLWDDDSPAPEFKETRGRKSKDAGREDLKTLSIALLTLVMSLGNIPQDIKPNDSEIGIVSHHLTGIMIRHLPINGKMSADALDIIGLIAVMSTWYARVQPALNQRRAQATPPVQARSKTAPTQPVKEESPSDPFMRHSPGAGAWLQNAAAQAGVN